MNFVQVARRGWLRHEHPNAFVQRAVHDEVWGSTVSPTFVLE
jgi:hypothetical protein